MSGDARRMLSRQWIAISGGSCDVRMGPNALAQAETMLRGSVGRPRLCMAVVPDDMDGRLRETLARQLAAAGFAARWHEVPRAGSRTLDEACRLAGSLGEQGITGDDLCCAFGSEAMLSLASHVSGSWCEGISLVAIPEDAAAFLEGALAPQALDVGDRPYMLWTRPSVQHVLLDYDLVCGQVHDEAVTYARVLMVGAAMCASERDFSALWDSAAELMSGDESSFVDHLIAAAKARGKTLSSTAAAIRQSISYGKDFARALGTLVDARVPESTLLAEGMRFSARLAVAAGKLSVDDMLAQDELLDVVGAGYASCDVDPHQLKEAVRQQRFARTNRCMLPVPFAIGRVRMMTVEDGLMLEHASAWCEARGERQ